jgi:hypothetical protein
MKLDRERNFIGRHQLANGRVRLKPDGTRWRTGGKVTGTLANGVSSQYSHTISERCVSGITNADAHVPVASSRLNWRPRRFKWTPPFRLKTKSGSARVPSRFKRSLQQLPSDATVFINFVHRWHLKHNWPTTQSAFFARFLVMDWNICVNINKVLTL